MEDQITQITELFAAPRGNLEKVISFGGIPFYTSSALKENFIKAMSKTSRTSSIISTVIKLMGKQEFFVCYLTDTILKTVLRKQPPQFKGYAGLTMGKYIFVFVDNDTNIFGFASNNDLSITTLHELIHKTAVKFKSRFVSLFKPELVTFYKNYWEQLFMVKSKSLTEKTVYELVTFIFNNTESEGRNNNSLLEYYKILTDTFKDITTLNPDEFKKLVTAYIVLIKIIWKGSSSGVPSLIEKAILVNKSIISPLYTAYKTTFGINIKYIKELCYQELFAPSEIISLLAMSKNPSPKIYSIVNKL